MKEVYTVCTDENYKNIVKPSWYNKLWNYNLYTSINYEVDGWNTVKIDNLPNKKKKSRIIKICPKNFNNGDITVYLDSRFKIRDNLDLFIDDFLDDCDLAVMTHPKRRCIYDEANTCINLGLDDHDIINTQMQKYRNEGFPEDFGLNAGGIIFRRYNSQINEFMELWLDEILNYSYRDQLSFMYIVWKTRMKVKFVNWHELYRRFK